MNRGGLKGYGTSGVLGTSADRNGFPAMPVRVLENGRRTFLAQTDPTDRGYTLVETVGNISLWRPK